MNYVRYGPGWVPSHARPLPGMGMAGALPRSIAEIPARAPVPLQLASPTRDAGETDS